MIVRQKYLSTCTKTHRTNDLIINRTEEILSNNDCENRFNIQNETFLTYGYGKKNDNSY